MVLGQGPPCCSVTQSSLTLCDPMDCSTPGFPVLHHLLEFAQTHPPSIFPSIRIFSSESILCIKWPKFWNISLSISPANEYSGLISFRINYLGLLAVQGTVKNFLQHHSLKALVPRCSAFFMVQLSHPHPTTGKTIALKLYRLLPAK